MTDCFLCTETIKHHPVICFSCQFATCTPCTKKFLLNSVKTAHCMQCNIHWDPGFLFATFAKAWLTGTKKGMYRHHEKTIALEEQKGKLQETLADVPRFKREEKNRTLLAKLKDKGTELRTQWKANNALIRDVTRRLECKSSSSAPPAVTFLCPCPGVDCRGLINKSTQMCAVCEVKICARCWQKLDSSSSSKHSCPPDALKTVAFVRRDTKPCPKCATAIHKISGCDQVFCHVFQDLFSSYRE